MNVTLRRFRVTTAAVERQYALHTMSARARARVYVCVFHAGRRTDMKKLMVAFRNFANTPNKTGNSRAGKR